MGFVQGQKGGIPGDSVMVAVHSPKNEVDLRLLCSILESENIPYFVHNDQFGSLRTGPRVELFNAKTILVPRRQAASARELIGDYLSSTETDRSSSVLGRARMVLETIFFGWFVPGGDRRR